MEEIRKNLLTQSDCFRAGRPLQPRGVMIHSTGVAQSDPEVFLRRWNQEGVSACVHAFVSQQEIIQTLPWDMRGWHAGKGERGSANNSHLSMECCEPDGHSYSGGVMVGYDPKRQQNYFEDVYSRAAALCARLCSKFGLDPLAPGVVICHAEGHRLGIASNHADVEHWWPRHGVTMDDFRREVARRMKEEETVTQSEFNAMLEAYLKTLGQKQPSDWSGEARRWAEQAGILGGDGKGNFRYAAFPSREEVVQMLWRLQEKMTEK